MSYQATKENPHPLDCWDRALPDEPRFALLARDPLFVPLVALWAALRRRDYVNAAQHFASAIWAATFMPAKPNDGKKALAAAATCGDAALWRLAKNILPAGYLSDESKES